MSPERLAQLRTNAEKGALCFEKEGAFSCGVVLELLDRIEELERRYEHDSTWKKHYCDERDQARSQLAESQEQVARRRGALKQYEDDDACEADNERHPDSCRYCNTMAALHLAPEPRVLSELKAARAAIRTVVTCDQDGMFRSNCDYGYDRMAELHEALTRLDAFLKSMGEE